jgi:hypothetical protein
VDKVAENIAGIVAANSAGSGIEGLGRADHLAGKFDRFRAFPDHGDDRAGGNKVDEFAVEGALFVDFVVLLRGSRSGE